MFDFKVEECAKEDRIVSEALSNYVCRIKNDLTSLQESFVLEYLRTTGCKLKELVICTRMESDCRYRIWIELRRESDHALCPHCHKPLETEVPN
jgi:hypothetical protein